jgi:hypothetical protein
MCNHIWINDIGQENLGLYCLKCGRTEKELAKYKITIDGYDYFATSMKNLLTILPAPNTYKWQYFVKAKNGKHRLAEYKNGAWKII